MTQIRAEFYTVAHQAPHVAVDGGAPADTTQRSRRGPRTGARRAWLAAVALGLRARQGRLRRRSTGAARSIDPAPARSQKPAAIRDRSITQARLRTSLAVAADAGEAAIAVSATSGCHRRNPVMRNSRRDHRGVGYRRSGQFFSDDFVAQCQAFGADRDLGSGRKTGDLVAALAAEAAFGGGGTCAFADGLHGG